MASKRLLVLSFDALAGSDMEYMKSHPVFEDFFKAGAVCTNVSSVYPSVTYPSHVSIVTGKYPKDHGVTANTRTQPHRVNTPDWYWQGKYIKTPTIYDLAIRAGMKVGAFLWPATARSKIHYLLPEVFPNRKWDFQLFTALRNGSPALLLRLFLRHRHLLKGISQPGLDDFVTQGVLDTIREKRPDLLLVHLTDLDTTRHDYGVHSPEAYAAIDRLAVRFEKIVQQLKAQQLYEDTTMVILGDHGQLDFHTKVPINEKLAEGGWLDYVKEKPRHWKAFAKSNGGSAYIYSQNKDIQGLGQYLKALQKDPANGIAGILTAKEAAAEGADPQCAFMLEAKVGYTFIDFLGAVDKAYKADHGYHPTDKAGFETFYAMAGPEIKKGFVIEEMSLLDIAPTWAKLLGLPMKDVEGRALDVFTKN